MMPEGSFEPTVMFFGLTNSPATFQAMIYELLRDLINIVKIADDGLNFYFYFLFYFYFPFLFFPFLFLEQLGLGVISHAVTSVTK